MSYFNKRFLKYETNASDKNYLDYGEVVQVITDKIININMGGTGYILEAVSIHGNYIPRLGDWVTVEWSNGNPIATGGSDINGGLRTPNPPVVISTGDLANGTINSDHIRTNTVEARHISAHSIQADHISANTIQTEHISANTIVASQIQAGAINATHIVANSIGATQITANAITSVHIQANAIQVQHLSANSVQTNQISANSIDATKIKADAINATHISANSITSSEISANSINATHITTNAIQTQHLSANIITGDKIQTNSISANHITVNAINATHITANAINAGHITANSIGANQITANAIRAQHISANSVQAGHISANSIQSEHISSNAINAGHIQAGVINATHITANAIASQHISSNTIQGQHISANSISGNHIVAGTIQTGHISANSINAGHITANAINAGHITANAIQAQHITANAIQTQHLSANSIYGNKISANQISANHITANAINATHITANAIQTQHLSANSITGDKILGETITGDKISGGTITGDKISGGTINTDHLSVGTRKEGLLGQYYTYSGNPSNKFQSYKGHQIDPTVNFSWGTGSPSIVGQSDSFAIRWQGFIYAPETGSYSFHLTVDDIGKVVVNNTVVVNIASYTGVEATGTISLTQGQWYPILIEMAEGTGGATAIVKWTKPSLVKEVVPSKYYSQGNTVIDGATITTGSITASSIQVGTITAQSGIIADATIQTAHIASGSITNAKIANGEITTAKIASGNITNALIADATITYAKIASVNADTITVGMLNGQIISGGTITGDKISGGTITGDKIKANSIDSLQIKSGAITTTELSAGSVTSDKIQAGSITSDTIRAGSITAEHISTIGLDAQLLQVYNSETGETLIGGGYLRVDGLDAGVVQSDNLMGNGLFLTASSASGFKRDNPIGEVLLGNSLAIVGGNELWKIDVATGQKLKAIDIMGFKPSDIAIHPSGNFAYVTVKGSDMLHQIDLVNDVMNMDMMLTVGKGPNIVKYVGDKLGDHKHLFVLSRDADNVMVPDSLSVIDTPPDSVNGDLYNHHWIALGNGPFDVVVDDNLHAFVTMADDGDIVMIDVSDHDSHQWKVKGRIPISAYGTDNYHGGLPGFYGLNEVTGGDSAGQYDSNMSTSSTSTGSHSHGSGYGSTDGSLKKYTPTGISTSQNIDTLYVADSENNELVVIDKYGNAPYNALTGRDTSAESPAHSLMHGVGTGGGPRTSYVRYRIPVGGTPQFIEVVNGKIFVTLEGSGEVAIIDESQIINEINADNTYYGKCLGHGMYENWNPFQPMRTTGTFTVRRVSVGSKPSFMEVRNNRIFVTLSGQNQIAVFDAITETVTQRINTGSNPKGSAITPDGQYIYVVNHGGAGDLSMVYPKGSYIGDAFLGLEGGVVYQGAEHWTPDRDNWVYDASGNIRSKSTVEFRINEPFLNEGGYAKLTAYGTDYQYAQIEQDIYNATNYSNGNNVIDTIGEKLITVGTGNTIFRPKAGEWLSSPPPSNINIAQMISGSISRTTASASQYSIYYGSDCKIVFSANAVPIGSWVEANYTARNNIYFKTHNASALVAIENSSSPNFNVTMEVDEFVPKFVVYDNRQTNDFIPTDDGINDTYAGLEYSFSNARHEGLPDSTITASGPISVKFINSATGSPYRIGSITDKLLVDPNKSGIQIYGPHNDSKSYITVSGSATKWVKIELPKAMMTAHLDVWFDWHSEWDLGTYTYTKNFSDGTSMTTNKAHKTFTNVKVEVSEDGNTWTTFNSASEVNADWFGFHNYETFESYNSGMIGHKAIPTKFVRISTDGWKVVHPQTGAILATGTTMDLWKFKVYGDWDIEYNYKYPANTEKAGQQIATNGKGFVSSDINGAFIALDMPIEYTTWWYMTYITGPDFGKMAIDTPSMNMSHFIELESSYVNKIAHRHIMSMPPSLNIKEDTKTGVKQGKHRIYIRQVSGRISFDRLRFEDFQYFNRSSLLIPSQSTSTVFRRYKLISEQAKWYQGVGRQSTDGAFDTPRVNPDTGLPDKSVPIKYRFRFRTELNANGTVEERGIAYFTSAIFETGKLHTHWRRSEGIDSFPAHRLERWDSNQPGKTGIQHDHLANASVKGAKIAPNTIMDWHISNYARISEHKLDLNNPTHAHGRHKMLIGQGPMGTDLHVFEDNLDLLNSIENWYGISGNYGTGNTLARGDHKHDNLYLSLTGGTLTNTLSAKAINAVIESHFSNGTYADPASGASYGLKVSQGIATDKMNVSGNITVTGNISITGTVDGVDVSNLNTSFSALSGNVTNHIGLGGSAHAVANSTTNGFISFGDFNKLATISTSANNYVHPTGDGNLHIPATGTGNVNKVLKAGLSAGSLSWANVDWAELTGKPSTFAPPIATSSVLGGVKQGANIAIDANGVISGSYSLVSTSGNGLMSFGDFNKLATISTSANNYVHPTGDGNLHVPASGTGNVNKVLKATSTAGTYTWGSVDWNELINKPSTFTATAHTHSANQITDLYSNIYTKNEVDTAVANAGDIKAGQANIFTNLNTFNNAGIGIKIQPSAGVANSTKLFQINNTTGSELFSINYSGGVSIAGDFTVTGVQTYSGTTTVNGDYTVNGQLIVGGNSTLGDTSTDMTTVNGTLKVQNGSIQEVGKYVQVHRRPIYGIAGDLQFQTDSTIFEDITDYYDISAFALPTVQSGATRYYRLYVVYSDDITSTQATAGQKSTIRIAGGTNKDIDLAQTWGAVNGRRDWLSAYFTDLPTGNGKIQAKLATTGNNLGIRWVELIAYDKF